MRPGLRHKDGGRWVVGGWSVTILGGGGGVGGGGSVTIGGGGGVVVVWGHSKHCIVWRFKASF